MNEELHEASLLLILDCEVSEDIFNVTQTFFINEMSIKACLLII